MMIRQQADIDGQTFSFLCETRHKNAKYQIKLIYHPQKGLIVRQARNVSFEQVKQFLHQHKKWINDKLFLRQRRVWRLTNMKLWFLGGNLPIQIRQSASNIPEMDFSDNQLVFFMPQAMQDILNLHAPSSIDYQMAKEAIQAKIRLWYKQQAKQYFPDLLYESVDLCPWVKKQPVFSIRMQKTRWGSCSSKGRLSLNAALLQFDSSTIKGVILHELCHLRYMNHSPSFYHLLTSVDPDWQIHHKNLKLGDCQIFSD